LKNLHGKRFHKGNKKEDKSFDLSSVVDYGEKLSNFFGDIMKLDRFA